MQNISTVPIADDLFLGTLIDAADRRIGMSEGQPLSEVERMFIRTSIWRSIPHADRSIIERIRSVEMDDLIRTELLAWSGHAQGKFYRRGYCALYSALKTHGFYDRRKVLASRYALIIRAVRG